MTKFPCELHSKAIEQNKTSILLMGKDITFIKDEIRSIKNNHLQHIQKAIEQIQSDITSLRQNDTKGAFLDKLGYKIIDTIIMALVIGGLIILGLKIK